MHSAVNVLFFTILLLCNNFAYVAGSKEYCEQKEEMLSDDNDSKNNDEIVMHSIGKESISEKKKENSNGIADSAKHEDKNGDEKDEEGLTEQLVRKMA